MAYRIVFFGTPEIAVPSLRALATDERFLVTLCVSQPDKPQGRNHQLQRTPVARTAEELGIPVIQPETLRAPEVLTRLTEEQADFFVVIAYGKILRQEVLDMPRIAPINVHGSLLPLHRGASPIQATLLSGSEVAGLTFMRMTAGMDEGPMLQTVSLPVTPETTAGMLFVTLAELSAQHLGDVLASYAEGKLPEIPQEEARATVCGKLTKEMGHISIADQSAKEIHRLWQALTPWPGIFTFHQGKRIKLLDVQAVEGDTLLPGAMQGEKSSETLLVGTREGTLALRLVQPEGKKPMSGQAFFAGVQGDRFGL